MAHVAKHLSDGIPAGMAATLQMQSIGGHDIADVDVPRYLLAKDSYGYQVAVCPALAWKDQWSDIMQSGLGTWPAFSAEGFMAHNRVATLIYNDLITRVTLTDSLFICAHGPYAAVAHILAKMLVAHGNRVRTVYTSSLPRSFTDPVWNALDALDVNSVAVRRLGDFTSNCPPTLLSYNGWGRGILTFATGRTSVLPDLSRFGHVHYVGQGYSLVSPNDETWPNTQAALRIGEPLHWHDNATNAAIDEGSTDQYIIDTWRMLHRGYHARLDDWRNLLNTNYGFVLPSLQNLGI
jgi:hypothetical protein